MGCVGMSRMDFELCTPLEFRRVYDSWSERERRCERDGWERARWCVAGMLQPWCKKGLKPKDVARFPWDDEEYISRLVKAGDDTATTLSESERYEAAKKRLGLR